MLHSLNSFWSLPLPWQNVPFNSPSNWNTSSSEKALPQTNAHWTGEHKHLGSVCSSSTFLLLKYVSYLEILNHCLACLQLYTSWILHSLLTGWIKHYILMNKENQSSFNAINLKSVVVFVFVCLFISLKFALNCSFCQNHTSYLNLYLNPSQKDLCSAFLYFPSVTIIHFIIHRFTWSR